ncbi:MAG TPA: hypothetical protein VE890_05710, partial [Thermoguttaceae bacterium]|nr:hypothetical protein [Thermoguttaceae bacterium]
CHDIPGFEQAPSIGPALTDWGRKHESLLAFGQIRQFVADDGAGQGDARFFTEALREHRREGFLWQKLRQPRSFDYRMTDGRPYNQGLTMPRFELAPEQREAIMTFVLGLTADPPAERYVTRASGRRRAVVEGRAVLAKYACAECHTLEMERWTFEFDPDEFYGPIPTEDYAFMQPHFSPEQIAASMQTNEQGSGTAQVIGMPRLDSTGRWLEDEDDYGNPLYFFTLWQPAVINGEVWNTGGAEVMISEPQLTDRRPAVGGAVARLLFPAVLARARAAGSATADQEAWGWVPPPLVHEGGKVQSRWLRDYLLRPTPIRPAAVLRMPRFNMSPAEAAQLADYFTAASDAGFPSIGDKPDSLGDTGRIGNPRLEQLDRAWKILTDDMTFCAKCHLIGDFSPGGATGTSLAPDLERVGGRIRPEFLRRWLAHPTVLLPYTGMPVNFPPSGDPLDQDHFPGSSTAQMDAVMQLLLRYDAYLRSRTSIRQLIETRSQQGDRSSR